MRQAEFNILVSCLEINGKLLVKATVSFVYFLAYFQKMKVCLSNHQPVCLCVCVCVCPPLITSEPIGEFS
jgi:hypothetical protein